jgi:iron(III) transport system permease protein
MPTLANCRCLPGGKLALAAVVAAVLAALWLADPRVGRLWLNTAILAGEVCLIALPLGTLLAILLFKTDVPGRQAALWLLVGMLFVPLYLVTGAWDAGFGIQGWHTLSTNPHLAHQPWLAGWRAAVWVHGLAAVPWVVLIVGAGLRTVEAEIEEDASTCATPPQVLWHVSIPRAAPAIAIAAVWIAAVVMTEISVTDFFQVRTFAEEVYTQAALGTFDAVGPETNVPTSNAIPAIGLWSGLLLSMAVAVAVIAGARRLFSDLADAPQRDPWIWRLKTARWPAAFLLACLMFVLAGVPLINLAYKAGVQVTATDTGRIRAWSPWKLVESVAAAPIQFKGELWLSLWIGTAAATTAILIALPLAWSLRTSSSLWERQPCSASRVRMPGIRLLVIALCLTIPGPLLGLAVIHLLDQPPDSPLSALAQLYDSNFAPWLVQTLRGLPIATLILWPAFGSIPQVMLDAAMTDGAGWWRQLALIVLPQRWTAVIAAWLVALAIAVGELAATVLVMPPQSGRTALSIQVFQLLHYGVDDRVAAISLVMVAAIAALTGIAGVLLKRKDRRLGNAPMTNDE